MADDTGDRHLGRLIDRRDCCLGAAAAELQDRAACLQGSEYPAAVSLNLGNRFPGEAVQTMLGGLHRETPVFFPLEGLLVQSDLRLHRYIGFHPPPAQWDPPK